MNKNAVEILNQIKNDYREYLLGVGNCYPPNEFDYEIFMERMAANEQDIDSLIE